MADRNYISRDLYASKWLNGTEVVAGVWFDEAGVTGETSGHGCIGRRRRYTGVLQVWEPEKRKTVTRTRLLAVLELRTFHSL